MIRRPPRSPLFPYPTLFRSVEFRQADAFEVLSQYSSARRKFGTVVLDPPAFAKSRAHLPAAARSEEHTSELQSRLHLVCRLLLEKKKTNTGRSLGKIREEHS